MKINVQFVNCWGVTEYKEWVFNLFRIGNNPKCFYLTICNFGIIIYKL